MKLALVKTVWLIGLYFVASAPAAATEPSRPNIVIILVDDMGFSDLGCYGGEIDTPHLDRLAAGGLRFTQFYNAGRCCPTRASLLTGRHPHQVGIGHMTAPPQQPLGFEGAYQGYLNRNCTTIAQVLSRAGYHTLMAGKWHLGMHLKESWPLQRGFDRYYGCLSGAINYFKPGGDRGIVLDNTPVETDENFYATDTFTDYATKFVDEAAEQDSRPFFLYLAYNAPHWPLNSKWEEFMKYKGKYRNGWHVLMKNRLAKQKTIGLVDDEIVPAPHVGPKWDSLTEQQQEDLDSIMAAYAGCIDSIDQNVGKLLRHLDRLNKLDNTVIFFLSDNGACQEGGALGQGSLAMVKNPPLETTRGVRQGVSLGQRFQYTISTLQAFHPRRWRLYADDRVMAQRYPQIVARFLRPPVRLSAGLHGNLSGALRCGVSHRRAGTRRCLDVTLAARRRRFDSYRPDLLGTRRQRRCPVGELETGPRI